MTHCVLRHRCRRVQFFYLVNCCWYRDRGLHHLEHSYAPGRNLQRNRSVRRFRRCQMSFDQFIAFHKSVPLVVRRRIAVDYSGTPFRTGIMRKLDGYERSTSSHWVLRCHFSPNPPSHPIRLLLDAKNIRNSQRSLSHPQTSSINPGDIADHLLSGITARATHSINLSIMTNGPY